MAISHSHLTLLLFLSFIWLPTLLAIPFTDCGDGSSRVNVTSVDVIKDRTMGGFQISAFTSKFIFGGYMEMSIQIGSSRIVKKKYDLCDIVTCPVPPGAFVLLSEQIFNLDAGEYYNVSVSIYEDYDEEQLVCLTFRSKFSDVASA